MCQRHTSICPHCQKHYDEPVKIKPRKNTLPQIILVFVVTVLAGSIAGILIASLVISAITGKPQIHYPGENLPEIVNNHRHTP